MPTAPGLSVDGLAEWSSVSLLAALVRQVGPGLPSRAYTTVERDGYTVSRQKMTALTNWAGLEGLVELRDYT